MKKETTKRITITIFLIVIFVSLFFLFKKYEAVKSITQSSATHRLNSCQDSYGATIKDREDYYASSSVVVDGYKVLLDCSHAINSYSPEHKDEYFVVKDIKKEIKYYILDNKKDILGGLHIIGIKDNLLFYDYCWEGCSSPEYIQLPVSVNGKEVSVYPENIDVLYKQGLPRDSQMEIYKNKVLFLSAHKIQELNTPEL
jgi:hypothetical protein